MKTLLLLIISISIINLGYSQECNSYFPLDEGNSWEITDYSSKGKINGKTQHKVNSKSTNGDQLEVSISTTSFDKKDKETGSSAYKVKCSEGSFFVESSYYMDDETMASTEGMEVEVDGDFIEFPSSLNVGDELKDGSMSIKAGNNGITIMTIVLDIKDRKVESKESITTAAGTFECYKISYTSSIKMGFITKTFHVVQWYSNGTGMIKSETYNKGKKLMGYSELTALSK